MISRSLLKAGKREIGRYPEGLCISVDLGIGITLALLHKFGNFPEVKKKKSIGLLLMEQ